MMVLINPRTVTRMLAALITSGTVLTTGFANAQGISYTLAPAAASLNWDKDLGLKNHSLYGGQASIDFERLVSLQGYYFTNDKISTAVDKLGLNGSLGDQLRNQRLQVRSMGANVIWKFWSGGVAPFIKTGGGIVELRPDSGHTSKQIALNAGAGLRFGANAPLFLDIFAEDMMLRVDRYALFNHGSAVVPVDPRANALRHNLMIGAAVGVPLGLNTNDREREMASELQWGLTGASLTLEPFAGRLKFDSKGSNAAIADQDLAGVRAGIDVGRYVGVRGFYWRSTDKDFKRFSSLQSWGGELQFRLNSSQGLTPYLLLGAAQLDFRKQDSTALSKLGTDKASLLLGGGIAIPLGERIALNFSARDYLYGQGNGADSVSSPSDLRNNWMYSIGLRVSVAGHSGSAAARRSVGREQSLSARVREDSLRLIASREDMRRGYSSPDSARGRRMPSDSQMVVADTNGMLKNVRPGSVITVPVPTVGEFYVR
ncbi:MAG: porin family protein, partial [Gemmatimonadota bacterium]|nr:porin family protein [Gemmatimonadota bacterium]